MTMPTPLMLKRAEALFQVLPVDTYEEARLGMQRELGERLSIGTVGQVFASVRRYPEEHGFFISPCKKGPPDPSAPKGRMFAMLHKADGTFEFDGETRDHFDGGSYSSLTTSTQMLSSMSKQLDVAIENEPVRVRRDLLVEVQENVVFTVRKLVRTVAKMEERAA